jgi:hypothetical protein
LAHAVSSYKTLLRVPNGRPRQARETAAVYTGNRTVTIAALVLLGSMWAMAAGDAHEDGTEAMYFEPGIADHPAAGLQCGDPVNFERIQHTGGAPLLDFKWTAETGELSFRTRTAMAGVTLPERFVNAASVPPAVNCESR